MMMIKRNSIAMITIKMTEDVCQQVHTTSFLLVTIMYLFIIISVEISVSTGFISEVITAC